MPQHLHNPCSIPNLSKIIFTLSLFNRCRQAHQISSQPQTHCSSNNSNLMDRTLSLSVRATMAIRHRVATVVTWTEIMAAPMALPNTHADMTYKYLMRKNFRLQKESLEQRDATWSASSLSAARICHRELKLWNCDSGEKDLDSKKDPSRRNQKNLSICVLALASMRNIQGLAIRLNSCFSMFTKSSRNTVNVPARTSDRPMVAVFYR